MGDDALVGRTLSTYRIERLLGRGGMARVYYAWDTSLDRPAAIKVIDTEEQTDPAYAKRIVQEAKAIARWRHENIVQVYHADSEDGLFYFAMEYVEGKDLGHYLAEYVRDNELIPSADLIRIGCAVARALDYAHEHGVIHRDVKPANVLLADDARIVLADFGLALNVQQGTMGEVFGSPHYIAPEQAVSSSNAVPQSDLYSFAIILYEMLVGRVPFDDPSPISLAIKHISEPLPLPSVINPVLSIATEAVLLKALSKEPDERFQSGEALMSALEESLKPPPAPTPEPTREVSHITIAERIAENAAVQEAAIAARQTRPKSAPPPAQSRNFTLPAALIVGGLGCIFALGLAALSLNLFSASTDATPTLEAPTTQAAVLDVPLSATTPAIAPTLASTESAAVTEAPTLAETDIPAVTQPPTPTIVYPDGYQLVLYYTDTGFYLRNPGDQRVAIRPIRFEALDAAVSPTIYRFGGNQWAELYPEVWPSNCNAVEIVDFAGANRPADCRTFNATRTPAAASEQVFWIARDGVTQFRVLWNDAEIARCEISAGRCEVYVPLES